MRTRVAGPVLVILAVLVALATASPAAPVAAQGDPVTEGTEVYQAACAACHGPDGSGVPGAFPPLRANPNAADAAHVEDVVRNGLSGPIDVLGVTYDAAMPAQSQLSDEEVAAVVAFVVSIAEGEGEGAEPLPSAAAPPAPAAGDAARGEDLYLGHAGLENGGAACVACHTAGRADALGGSGLGPDLTGAFDRFGGEQALAGTLRSLPFPTMQPIFDERPLTDEEVSDLVAYFAEVRGTDARSFDVFWPLGLAGLVVLLALTAVLFARPRTPYAQRLRSAR